LPYYLYERVFPENSSGKDETKTPLVSYQYYKEKKILKNLKQNRGTVSLQHNRGVSRKYSKILKQNEGAMSLLHSRRIFQKSLLKPETNRRFLSLLHNERVSKNSFPKFWTFSGSVS